MAKSRKRNNAFKKGTFGKKKKEAHAELQTQNE